MEKTKYKTKKPNTRHVMRHRPNKYDYEKIIDSLPRIAVVFDSSGKILKLNRRWYKYAGTNKKPKNRKWIGEREIFADRKKPDTDGNKGNKEPLNLLRNVHPEDIKRFSIFLKKRIPNTIQLRLREKTGKYRCFAAELGKLPGVGQKTIWLATFADITAQKEAEESLMATKSSLDLRSAKHEALMESLGEAIVATDVDQRIVLANGSAQDMFGFKEKDLIGISFHDIIMLYDKLGGMVSSEDFLISMVLKTGKKATDSSLYYATKHRKKFPASVTTSPVLINGKTAGTISVFRNTRREAQIDKAKTEFVSLASHQLRTPLTSIKLFTEMLLSDQHGKWSHEQRDMLESIERSNEKMISLVDNLLDVANMEAGRMWVEPVLLTPSEFINSVIMEAGPLAQSRGIDLVYRYDQEDSTEIDTDPYLLRQILNNIITNAIEYSRKNTKVIVRVNWQDDKECIISVQDHGIGITKKAQREIFNRFFRAENAIKFKTESSGLGLYVCKMMVEVLGGKITFKTEIQKGTTFYIHLPVKNPKLALKKYPRV